MLVLEKFCFEKMSCLQSLSTAPNDFQFLAIRKLRIGGKNKREKKMLSLIYHRCLPVKTHRTKPAFHWRY